MYRQGTFVIQRHYIHVAREQPFDERFVSPRSGNVKERPPIAVQIVVQLFAISLQFEDSFLKTVTEAP